MKTLIQKDACTLMLIAAFTMQPRNYISWYLPKLIINIYTQNSNNKIAKEREQCVEPGIHSLIYPSI